MELRSEGTRCIHWPREGGKVSVPQMEDVTCALTLSHAPTLPMREEMVR